MKTLKKLDNRGLTLVELIVGLAILAIIVTPLLHAFVSGAATERKGREYGEATIAAQNIVETIQAFDSNDDFVKNLTALRFGSSPGVTAILTDESVGKKTFALRDYFYNGKLYDARLSLDTSSAFNKDQISIGTAMDVVIDMSAVDATALDEYLRAGAALSGLAVGSSGPALSQLTRKMTVNVTDQGDVYNVAVTFAYSGGFSYRPEDAKEGDKLEFFPFETAVNSSAAVTKRTSGTSLDGSAFSLFLFYSADPGLRGRSSEIISINTPKGPDGRATFDFNVFLSNTGKANPGYRVTVEFKCQLFSGNLPAASRVFTNLKDKQQISYQAFRDDLYRKTSAVTGKLVASRQKDRYVDIVVDLFPRGSDFTSAPLATLKTTKLS